MVISNAEAAAANDDEDYDDGCDAGADDAIQKNLNNDEHVNGSSDGDGDKNDVGHQSSSSFENSVVPSPSNHNKRQTMTTTSRGGTHPRSYGRVFKGGKNKSKTEQTGGDQSPFLDVLGETENRGGDQTPKMKNIQQH